MWKGLGRESVDGYADDRYGMPHRFLGVLGRAALASVRQSGFSYADQNVSRPG